MKHRHILTLSAAALLSAAAENSSAQIIYSTGFENPAYQSSQPLVGQDSWANQIYQGNGLGAAAAAISTAHPAGGSQSVAVNGGQLTPTDSGYDVGSYRRFVNYDIAAAGFPVVRVAADLRIDGPKTTQTSDFSTGDYFSVNLAVFSNDGDLGEMSLSSDGHVYSYSAANAYIFERPINAGQYYRLAMDLDFSTRKTTYSVDGQVVGTEDFDPSFTSNILSRGSLVDYALDPDPLTRSAGAYTAYYDNFSVSAVPEPSAFAMIAMAIVPLARRRRKG